MSQKLQAPTVNEFLLRQLKDGSRETLSDMSETGTLSDELYEFAISLGLGSPAELSEDRFRVSRTKMELLMQGGLDSYKDAEVFFQQVMEASNTLIGWPKRLKIGAKNKKDPHVRISGLSANVAKAKKMVTSVLDNPHIRVTLKMDVSYTTHSHIIGRGGQSVNQVMQNTQCHIHFPDSNRYQMTEKNNQVTISGEMVNVEKARHAIRNLVPLIFEFELSSIVEPSPTLKQIQDNYGVVISIRSQPKLNGTLVSIKGSELEVARVKEATLLAINLFNGPSKVIMNVQMTMEISSQHHATVMGPNGSNIRAIMANTQTEIMFPDARDPNIASLKRTSIKIRGNIHSVYLARQQLIGSLPLSIIFELPQKTEPNREKIYETSQQLNVNISMRNIIKHNKMMVTIKGIEREASKIYESRKLLLELDEQTVVAEIPATYYIPVTDMKLQSSQTTINLNQNRPESETEITNGINALAFHTSQRCMMPQIPSGICPPVSKNVQFPMMTQTTTTPFNVNNPRTYNLFPNTLGIQVDNGYSSLNSNLSPISTPNHSPRYSPFIDEQFPSADNPNNIHYLPNPLRAQLEYEQWKQNAYTAIQANPVPSVARNPTSFWSGLGFSQSAPSVLNQPPSDDAMDKNWLRAGHNINLNGIPEVKMPSLESSNYRDRTPAWVQQNISNSNCLISLFISLGLESFIGLFTENEIDLTTFIMLNETDLINLGVLSFAARRKMLTAIKELSRHSPNYSFNRAPGAERRTKNSPT